MPPKPGALVITEEEEEIIRQRIIEQTATLRPGQPYPLKRLVGAFFDLVATLDAEEDAEEAKEAFYTELDTYEFNMGRYSSVVAAQRLQQLGYDDEEEALRAKTAELLSKSASIRTKLAESARERAFREARDETVAACREQPPRADSEATNAELERAIADARAHIESLDADVAERKAKYALLLTALDQIEDGRAAA